jgi:hypothetical protein
LNVAPTSGVDWEGGEIGAVLSVRDESVSDFTMLPN